MSDIWPFVTQVFIINVGLCAGLFSFSVLCVVPRGFACGLLRSYMAKTFGFCNNVWLSNSQNLEVSASVGKNN